MEIEVPHGELVDYVVDEDENWKLRPDVAGYEYPEDGCNWRIGIVRDVLDVRNGRKGIDAIGAILTTPFSDMVTRNMARVVLTAEMLKNPPDALRPFLPDLEVLINLQDSGNPALADTYQAVFARNAPERQTPPEIVQKELEETQRVFREGQAKRAAGTTERSLPDGITIQRVNKATDKRIRKGFIDLVTASFVDEDAADLKELFDDEDTVVMAAVAERKGKPAVVGSVYASKDADTLRRGGKNMKLRGFEISGAKVIPEMEGQGIYKALSAQILRELAKRKDVDIAFGYSNAQDLGVFSVAARTLVTDTAAELGLPLRPAMQQTVTDGGLVDEIVTYMPAISSGPYMADVNSHVP